MPSALPKDSFTPCGMTGQTHDSALRLAPCRGFGEAALCDHLHEVRNTRILEQIERELRSKADAYASDASHSPGRRIVIGP